MNRLKRAVQHYLSLRRALGYKLADASGLLTDFVAFLQAQGADHITIPLALQWAQRKSSRPAEWAHRLTCIRGFARYWSAFDLQTQIPPYSGTSSKRRGINIGLGLMFQGFCAPC